MKLILINGPPRSGKDTLGRALVGPTQKSRIFKFAGELKNAAHRLYNVRGADGLVVGDDYFEDRKDQPCPEFFGRTPREVYIAVSERLYKPLHGEDIFGALLAENIIAQDVVRQAVGLPVQVAVVTDSGFLPEAERLISDLGLPLSNVLLVRMHREGFNFVGDSRGYIKLPGIQDIDLSLDRHSAEELAPSVWRML